MSLESETTKNLCKLLKTVYDNADWHKIAGNKRSKYDIFAHKIKAAGHQQTVSTFMEKLCHSLGLQSIIIPTSAIQQLQTDCEAVMHAVRKETIYYMLLAIEGGET